MRADFLLLTLSFLSVFARTSPPVVNVESRYDSIVDLPTNVYFAPSASVFGIQDLVCFDWNGPTR